MGELGHKQPRDIAAAQTGPGEEEQSSDEEEIVNGVTVMKAQKQESMKAQKQASAAAAVRPLLNCSPVGRWPCMLPITMCSAASLQTCTVCADEVHRAHREGCWHNCNLHNTH